jgi:transposase
LMADCLDAPVSAGWLAGLLPAAADRLDGFTEAMRDQLQAAPVAHFDETGGRVAARLWWIHVACTDTLTLYHRAKGRGKDSINVGGVLPEFATSGGVGVHDGLNSYQGYEMVHGLCNAHHLRDLAGIAETTGAHWPP